MWENNGRCHVFLPATAKPTVSESQSGYDSEMSSVKPWGFFVNRLRRIKMKKVRRRNPWLWHATLVLILSNPRICWATSPLGCLVLFGACCAFTCPLEKILFFISTYCTSLISIPPSLLPLSSSSSCLSLPLPWHDNKSQGLRGSCLRWGVIICTVCKLSGHDELAALNRPLLTDTDGTSVSHH